MFLFCLFYLSDIFLHNFLAGNTLKSKRMTWYKSFGSLCALLKCIIYWIITNVGEKSMFCYYKHKSNISFYIFALEKSCKIPKEINFKHDLWNDFRTVSKQGFHSFCNEIFVLHIYFYFSSGKIFDTRFYIPIVTIQHKCISIQCDWHV